MITDNRLVLSVDIIILLKAMDDFTDSSKIHKFDLIYCPHCKKKVSKSTYYNHYNAYFNKVS